MRKLLRRPSPAMGVALVALFAGMGGTAVGASLIDGARLESRSVDYTKIKRDSLGGVVIKESRLGKVPRSARADSARNADNASSTGGLAVRKVYWKGATGGAAQTILDLNGLQVSAQCVAGAPRLSARTTVNDTQLQFGFVSTRGARGDRRSNFDVGDAIQLDGGESNGSGTLTYGRPDGRTVAVTISFHEASTFGSFAGCAAVGSAIG